MERKYTLTADDSDNQFKRKYEFHSPQRISIRGGDVHNLDVSNITLCAIAPNFRFPGLLKLPQEIQRSEPTLVGG